MKVVINTCYGGFSLSRKGVMEYAKLKGIKLYGWIDDISKNVYKEEATLDNPHMLIHYCTIPFDSEKEYKQYREKHPKEEIYFSHRYIERNDTCLIKVVEKLKKKANGNSAELKVVEIPDGIEWEIEQYDGREWIAEKHRTWS